MDKHDDDYKLGKDVTEKFRGAKKESVVLSVRMSIEEMKHLEAFVPGGQGKPSRSLVRESVGELSTGQSTAAGGPDHREQRGR